MEFEVGDIVEHCASGERAIITCVYLKPGNQDEPTGLYVISTGFGRLFDEIPGFMLEKYTFPLKPYACAQCGRDEKNCWCFAGRPRNSHSRARNGD